MCWTPPVDLNPAKTCEYQSLCARFKDLLLLPGEPWAPRGGRERKKATLGYSSTYDHGGPQNFPELSQTVVK